jgi:hypothetical protein
MMFAQIAASIGYQVRILTLLADRAYDGDAHAVTEAWVDDLDKWIVFDTDFNLHYIDETGMPLNALELHQALIHGSMDRITVVKGAYRPEESDIEQRVPQPLLIPYYHYFYIDMRNDWLTNIYFPGHPKRSDRTSLRWQEAGEAPFLDRIPVTRDPSTLYWPLNHVEIAVGVKGQETEPAGVMVYLKTLTPNFDHFEVRIDEAVEFSHHESHLTWPFKPGLNALSVRAVNAFGVGGPPSRLEILWSPLRQGY